VTLVAPLTFLNEANFRLIIMLNLEIPSLRFTEAMREGAVMDKRSSGSINESKGARVLPLLGPRLLDYAHSVSKYGSTDEVLDRLNTITSEILDLNVLGAVRFPPTIGDWKKLQPGRSVFLHGRVSPGFWEEWSRLAHHRIPIGYLLARTSLVPHTWTESMRLLQPLGVNRWGYEVALKYGMRDGLYCPVGGRWLLAFWSHKVLSERFTQAARIMVFSAASFAAMQLEQLVGFDESAGTPQPRLTQRELAVLRSISISLSHKETANALGLGEETIRTHLKKAQKKLGVRNRAHAAAEAVRQYLIP
jgi:DNA-binding CsgD family transcriptional regulator